MIKKYHAWKTTHPNLPILYGEDLAAKHSLEYSISECDTYYLFAARTVEYSNNNIIKDIFHNWKTIESLSNDLSIPLVPVIFKGKFTSIDEITKFFRNERMKPSAYGIEREGFVMRTIDDFNGSDFSLNVCKFVRANHIRTDKHWTKNWNWNKFIVSNIYRLLVFHVFKFLLRRERNLTCSCIYFV